MFAKSQVKEILKNDFRKRFFSMCVYYAIPELMYYYCTKCTDFALHTLILVGLLSKNTRYLCIYCAHTLIYYFEYFKINYNRLIKKFTQDYVQ